MRRRRLGSGGKSKPLEIQGKIHMHVERLRLEAGEAVGDGLEPFTHGIEMIQTFPQAEIVQVVG